MTNNSNLIQETNQKIIEVNIDEIFSELEFAKYSYKENRSNELLKIGHFFEICCLSRILELDWTQIVKSLDEEIYQLESI